MGRRRIVMILLAAALSGCRAVDEPANLVYIADLTTTSQLLLIEFNPGQTATSGRGSLSALRDVGQGTPLTYVSSQRSDTVQLTFYRESGYGFGFVGIYLRDRDQIAGKLNGSEFINVTAAFKRR